MRAKDDAIVNPVKRDGYPDVGPLAVMVCSQSDMRFLSQLFNVDEKDGFNLYMAQSFLCRQGPRSWSFTGPLVGAPYAVMILESLIAMGARKIIFFGWCGAVSPTVRIGDIILPSAALIDEGTSAHYRMGKSRKSMPSGQLSEKIKEVLIKKQVTFQEGAIWTTDAIFRETREKVADFQQKGVLGVEMELSALFTVGRFRQVEVGAILVVSDDLSAFEWRPGFGDQRFKLGRKSVSEVIDSLCRTL